MLATGEELSVEKEKLGLKIRLPEVCDEAYYSVIELRFNSLPEQRRVCQIRENRLTLTPFQAILNATLMKDYVPYTIKQWTSNSSRIEYEVYLSPGTYTIEMEYAAENVGKFFFNINNRTYTGDYEKTSDWNLMDFIDVKYEDILIDIQEEGLYKLRITREVIDGYSNKASMRNLVLVNTTTDGQNIPESNFSISSTYIEDGKFVLYSDVYKQYNIVDMQGKQVLETEGIGGIQVSVSFLPSGFYIVSDGTRKNSCKIYIK